MSKLYNLMIKKGIALSLSVACCLAATQQTHAQLNPFAASYFQNQYLTNPAMAGLDEELKINAGYRKQSNSVPDAPTNMYLTGDYGLGNKAGIGLNIYNENAGLIRSTSAMGTYSYHLPLNGKGQELHMGVSMGIMQRRLDNNKVNGDPDDQTVLNFNDRGLRFDADFGVAYTDKKLTVQGTFPNIATFFRKGEKDLVNKTTFFAAASYKLAFNESSEIGVEPKVCFRGVEGFDNIIDAGANFTFLENQLNIFGMYHTSKSTTLGAGLNIKKTVQITAIYTTETAALKTYGGGDFEIGLRLSGWSKKK